MQENIRMIQSVILFAGLAVAAVEDIHRKEVSSFPLIIMGFAGILLSIAAGEWKEWYVVIHFLPGILVLATAWLTKETIGYGDGLVILCLGCFLTAGEILDVCMAAITLAGVVALVMLFVMRKSKKTPLPFIPFLFAGCVILKLMQGG